MNSHQLLLEDLAHQIYSLPSGKIQRVAIDGVDGAGKTTLANSLASIIERLGREVIRASVDGFHYPREVRYRNGKGPESFFHASYNYPKLKEVLLDPLSPGGNLEYRSAIFNVDKDEPVKSEKRLASGSEVLVFDGIFLHRPELSGYWDYSIFLDVEFENSIPRGAARGSGSPDILAASNERYIKGQLLYLASCRPRALATVHIDYNDLQNPRIIRKK